MLTEFMKHVLDEVRKIKDRILRQKMKVQGKKGIPNQEFCVNNR